MRQTRRSRSSPPVPRCLLLAIGLGLLLALLTACVGTQTPSAGTPPPAGETITSTGKAVLPPTESPTAPPTDTATATTTSTATPTATPSPTNSPTPTPTFTATPTSSPTATLTTRPTDTPVPTATPPPPTPTAVPAPAPAPRTGGTYTVAIDAGHGGPSYPGAVHRSGLAEKDLNLKVSLKLAALLRAQGHRVVLTRDGDYTITPFNDPDYNRKIALEQQARADVANSARADVLISVHFNGHDDSSIQGTETYYCADRSFSDRSKKLAESVQAGLARNIRAAGYNTVDRGVKDDTSIGARYGQPHSFLLGANPDFERPSQMPGIFGEALFVSNDTEAGLLGRDDILDAVARGYLEGINAYFAWLEGRPRAQVQGAAFEVALPPPPAELPALPPSEPAVPGPDPIPAAAPSPVPSAEPTPPPALPPAPPAPPPVSAVEIVEGNTSAQRAALTFDAGSGATALQPILETLRKHNLRSTFFLTGQWAEKYPELVQLIAAEGHELANHSYTHPYFTQLSEQGMVREVERTEALVVQLTGKSTRPYFRPPFGDRDRRVLNVLARSGYLSVYWTLDSGDWRPELSAQTVLQRVLNNTANGSIVVHHVDSPQTAQVIEQIVVGLLQRGLTPGTLTEVLAQ